MVRGKGYLRLCHYSNERQQLDLKQEQLPQQNPLDLTNGGHRAVSLPVRVLLSPFKMLSVTGSGAPPAAAVQDQDEDQEDFGLYLADETKSQCKLSVVSTLPDIDPEYLTRVCTEAQWDANRVIDQIFDQMDQGQPYPRVPKPNLLKRKRDDDEEPSGPDKTAAKFDNEERRQQLKAASYKKTW